MMSAHMDYGSNDSGISTLTIAVQRDGKNALLLRADPAVEAALLDGAGCVAQTGQGRGNVFRFPLGDGWGILRPYRRGGTIRVFLKDAYLLDNRPQREWAVHLYLYEQGFGVAEPLGVMWERRGIIYRGAIATREVDARDLGTFALGEPERAGQALERVGAHIRHMHDLGVYHADLQIRNILVTRGDDSIVFIDLDNARRTSAISAVQRARNLLRLRRSCQKNGLDPSCFERIQQGYGPLRIPRWLDTLYRCKGNLSDATHKRKCGHAG